MSGGPQWSYVQARLHARHGERLQENDWRLLEAARSVDQFIERARASSLRRFADPLNARMTSRAIERTLRAMWHAYVAEVASWVPAEWRAAVLWTSQLSELPLIVVKAEAGAPTPAARWMAQWLVFWPGCAHEEKALRELAAAIAAQAVALERASAQETSAPYRRELARIVTRLFRRHSDAPVAVFCHLALVTIDLERLRGGLVRRRLFEPSHAKEAA